MNSLKIFVANTTWLIKIPPMTIIKFVFLGDGSDPTYMETKDRPVDFK